MSFKCPECGSPYFGSSNCVVGPMTRHCNGYIEQPDGSHRSCKFSFPESDDEKYGLGPALGEQTRQCANCVLGGDETEKPCEFREDTGIPPAWLCADCYDDWKNQPEPVER